MLKIRCSTFLAEALWDQLVTESLWLLFQGRMGKGVF